MIRSTLVWITFSVLLGECAFVVCQVSALTNPAERYDQLYGASKSASQSSKPLPSPVTTPTSAVTLHLGVTYAVAFTSEHSIILFVCCFQHCSFCARYTESLRHLLGSEMASQLPI